MIKGINKQMIEVSDVDSLYYERAFLIVKPEYSDYQEKILRREAKKLVENFGFPSAAKKKSNFVNWFIKLTLTVGVIAGFVFLLIMQGV